MKEAQTWLLFTSCAVTKHVQYTLLLYIRKATVYNNYRSFAVGYCSRLAQTVTDFADASHSESAKSTTTTVLYGIFSSENSYPCTVTSICQMLSVLFSRAAGIFTLCAARRTQKKTACRTFHTAAASFFIFMYIFTLPRASDSFSQEKLRTAHSRRHIQR